LAILLLAPALGQCFPPILSSIPSSGFSSSAAARSTLAFSIPAASKALTIKSKSFLRSFPYENRNPGFGISLPGHEAPPTFITLLSTAASRLANPEVSGSVVYTNMVMVRPLSGARRLTIMSACSSEIVRQAAYFSSLARAVFSCSTCSLSCAASLSFTDARSLASPAFRSALPARSSMFAMSCPDNWDVLTVLSNSPAIPRMSTIRDSRASLLLASLVLGRDVNSATNSPTQPVNTIAVEIYPNHSQQFNVAFRDPTSESVRTTLASPETRTRNPDCLSYTGRLRLAFSLDPSGSPKIHFSIFLHSREKTIASSTLQTANGADYLNLL